MTNKENIDKDYLEKLKSLNLPTKKQDNEWIILHMYGDGKRASHKFNFQVYRNKKGELKLVTNDMDTLNRLLKGERRVSEEGKRVILIDDSGWGFPLGGVLCGAYDFQTKQFYVKEVETEYFQKEEMQTKAYLDRYSNRALEIIDHINPDLKHTIIKICTGFVNIKAKTSLRERNFLVVEVDEIGEPLQTWLEEEHKRYIKKLIKEDIYYDPKGLAKNEVARKFYEVIAFAEKNDLMHLAKTGWRFFQDK